MPYKDKRDLYAAQKRYRTRKTEESKLILEQLDIEKTKRMQEQFSNRILQGCRDLSNIEGIGMDTTTPNGTYPMKFGQQKVEVTQRNE